MDEWTELRRFDDPLQAEMVADFLREHDVHVRMRGNAGATSILNRFSTVVDIRLDVPSVEIASAREALQAMDVGDSNEQPFRGREPAMVKSGTDEPYVAPRRTATAMMLGFIIPIGSAHFYARHGAAGGIFLAGAIAAFLGVTFGGRYELALAWAIIVVADLAGARSAVRRFNEGRVPSDGKQRMVAIAIVAAAFVVAFTLGRS